MRTSSTLTPSSSTPFVLLTGGKGGVGKTTLSAKLGVELAKRGRCTLLVDLDLRLANLHVLLRLAKGADIEDALSGHFENIEGEAAPMSRHQFESGVPGSEFKDSLLERAAYRRHFDLAALPPEQSDIQREYVDFLRSAGPVVFIDE